MNYLGHLFFSNNDKQLMLNNLYGDFVRGKDLSHLPKAIQSGVVLHRKIDDYIDNFPAVNALQVKLYEELPKISSVAIDLFFDHILAKNWSNFHSKEINLYLNEFYESIDLNKFDYSPKFKIMIHKLLEHNWISHYSSLEGLDKMCHGVSSRISFDNELKNGLNVFLKHEEEIKQVFEIYMENAIFKFNVQNSK